MSTSPSVEPESDEPKLRILGLPTVAADDIAYRRDEFAAERGMHVVVATAGEWPPGQLVGEAFADSRAAVEQATGMLMLIYRISAESALELLQWRSEETNVELGPLAAQVTADFRALTYGTLPPPSAYHRLLLTAHLRVGGAGMADIDSAMTSGRPLEFP